MRTIDIHDGRIWLTQMSFDDVPRIKQLANARWHKEERAWSVPATPAVALQLSQEFRGCEFSFDHAWELLEQQASALIEAQDFRTCDPAWLPETGYRTLPPWLHQRRAFAFARHKEAAMLAMDMGCVAGDAEIVVNRGGCTRRYQIREAFRRFHGLTNRGSVQTNQWFCRALKGDRFGQHVVENILFKGTRAIVRLSLSDGRVLRCTPDHEICCPTGWTEAGKLLPGDTIVVNGRSMAGEKNPNWRGGKSFIDKDGYARIAAPSHPRANRTGHVYEHIIIAESNLSRALRSDEEVHHINNDRSDNRPENLEVLPRAEHRRRHDPLLHLDGGRTINGGVVVVVPKTATIMSVEPDGETDVYDIVMAEPWRNFAANGVVVHNCGKSKVACDLALDRRAKAVLIACPSNVMQVWRREFAIHAGDEYDVVLLNRDHRVSRRLLTTQMQLSVNEAKGRRTAIVINHEALWREPFGAWVKSPDHPFDMFIFDESHRGKQHNGQLGKYVADLWRFVPNRLALTGTPFPHDQLDIFAQFRMLDPGVYGMSWTRFKERYAVLGGWENRQVVGVQNIEDLQAKFQLLAYQVFADDVLDLPEAIETFRTFKLTPEARKIYDQLEKDFLAEVGQGQVLARNALVKLLRLQQITSGYCKVEGHTSEPFEAFTGEEKIKLLQDLLENELPRPVVVFCRFREDLRRIRELTGKLGLRYGEVSGAASDLNDDATLPDWIDVLGVQEQAGGLGIDLTRAHVAVFYSVDYRLDNYQQCMRRLRRPGQTKNVLYVHLVAENSIDEEIYEALTSRQELIDLLQNRRAA